MKKPTYVKSGDKILRFPSQEEAIRNGSDQDLDMILYGCGLEYVTEWERSIAEDEVARRLKGAAL
jgi:hypothetical protein